MTYSPGVVVISLPCTSGIRPSWILHAIEQGFDGVFIASDGDECAYLADCSTRASRIVAQAQELLVKGWSPVRATEDGRHLLGLRGTVHQARPAVRPGAGRARAIGGDVMTDYDVLVVGAGIGGMESALKLGDMGYRVLLVEKEASVGGKMILLSKVFPTLDCASCISTPKMAASIHHPNVTTLTYSEVEGIEPVGDGRFQATITQKARFVDEAACTGCQKCETACTVSVPDQFNADMVARHAAYIAFPQAVPKKAVIERAGSSPCSFTCPAGIQAHGYVSLIRSGEYEKAFQLVLDATPLVGTLGRACYAPCEVDCTRGSLEGPLPIRRLKRFIADEHYDRFDGPGVEVPEPNGHRVAIVGSGPAGLTAAWQLARKGYGGQDLRGGAQGRRLPAPGHPRLPAPVRGRRARHRQRHRARRRDRREHAGRGPRGAPRRRLRRRPRGDRDAALDPDGRARRPARWRPQRRRLPARREARRGRRPHGPARRRDRRRQRRDGHRPDRPTTRRPRRHRRLPAHPRGDAGPPRRGGRHREGRRRLPLPGGPGRRPRRRPRRDTRTALQPDDQGRAGRVRPEPAGAGPGQRVRHRLRRDHHRHRHGARHRGVRGPGPGRAERDRSRSTSGPSRPTCPGCSPPATSCPAPRTSPGRPARASAPRS